ncbi:hypothetical protein B7463_g6747, partial [Scytalidium lignicola]
MMLKLKAKAQWVPQTPHNPVQLQLQSQSIQQLLREQHSPTTPTKKAMNQLVKGFEMVMHEMVFMTKDIEALRAENASIQAKLHKPRKRLVHTGSLTAQEAQALAQSSATVQNVLEVINPSTSANSLSAPPRRPPKCSECGNIGHNRLKCPNLASH